MVLWPEIQGIVAIPHDGQPLPQGPHYADWLLPIVRAVERVLIPGGVLALNLNGQAAWTFPEEVVVRVPRETGLVLHERVCWVKTNAIPVGRRESHLIPEWEPIWVFRKGPSLAFFGRDDIRRPYSEATQRRAARGYLHRGRHGNHRTQAHPYVRRDKPEFIHPLGRDASNVLVAAPEQSPKYPHPARFPEALPAFFIAAYCPPTRWDGARPFCRQRHDMRGRNAARTTFGGHRAQSGLRMDDS